MTDNDKKYFEYNFIGQLILRLVSYFCILLLIVYGFKQIYKDLIRIESKIDKIEIITNTSLDINSHIEEYVDSIEMFNYKKELNYNLNYD